MENWFQLEWNLICACAIINHFKSYQTLILLTDYFCLWCLMTAPAFMNHPHDSAQCRGVHLGTRFRPIKIWEMVWERTDPRPRVTKGKGLYVWDGPDKRKPSAQISPLAPTAVATA